MPNTILVTFSEQLEGQREQYIYLVKALYYKLPTNNQQLEVFPHENKLGFKL